MFRSTALWREAQRMAAREPDSPLQQLFFVLFYIGVAKEQHQLFWNEVLNIKMFKIKPWTIDQYVLLGEEILHMWGEIPVWNPFHSEPIAQHKTVYSLERFESRMGMSDLIEVLFKVNKI